MRPALSTESVRVCSRLMVSVLPFGRLMFMPYSTHGKKMMTAIKSCSNRSTSGITLISVMPCKRPYRRDLVCDIIMLDRRYKLVGEIFHLHRLMPDARRNPVVCKQRRHGDQ